LDNLPDGGTDGFDSSAGGFSQEVLELGEELFDRIQIGGVFRQEEELGPYRANELTHGFAFVAAEIVHDHDIAGLQRRKENLLHIELKAVAIDRPLDEPRRVDPVMTQSRQEGHCLPTAVWNFACKPLATWRPSPQWCHVGPGPGFVDEDQPLRIDTTLIFYPLRSLSRYVATIAFASHHAFF
jgi:hypothetical protein